MSFNRCSALGHTPVPLPGGGHGVIPSGSSRPSTSAKCREWVKLRLRLRSTWRKRKVFSVAQKHETGSTENGGWGQSGPPSGQVAGMREVQRGVKTVQSPCPSQLPPPTSQLPLTRAVAAPAIMVLTVAFTRQALCNFVFFLERI